MSESTAHVGIKYVGKKNRPQHDTVTGSGLVWGDGEVVLAVPHKVAEKLLRHPDVWAKTDLPKEFKAPKADLADLLDQTPPVKKPEEPELPPLVNLDNMSREEMMNFAQTQFGQKLPYNMTEGNIRLRIQSWMNGGRGA